MDSGRIALVTLGCARNEVDSEEVAGSLAQSGWELVADAGQADVVVVNTCGFVDAAKQESIEVLLAAHEPRPDGTRARVVAIGCLAQRYGAELAAELPEADAVLGFDEYPQLSQRLAEVLGGGRLASHQPSDRRLLLPISPVDRPAADVVVPGHSGASGQLSDTSDLLMLGAGMGDGAGPGWHWARRRISSGPVAACKIASGCDRRCAFCAIPAIRGLFVSRPVAEVVAEASWLVDQGVRELVLVSENSTSYGKDLPSRVHLEDLLVELDAIAGLQRIRVSYLQPAEVRPALVQAMVELPSVADYFDLSFQHAAPGMLRRMRRFGGSGPFLELLSQVRELAPEAGVRSNFILGFPGETAGDLDELAGFLSSARLDAIGLFGYSDEDGTEGAGFGDKVDPREIARRVDEFSDLADELMSQRADDRIGLGVQVMVEALGANVATGRAAHQGPDDSTTTVHLDPEMRPQVGSLLTARLVAAEGVDLVAVSATPAAASAADSRRQSAEASGVGAAAAGWDARGGAV